ncbi:hypothetical protein WME76_21870 [Sorangium sp. So ce119]|uniref:hypothetical protein n=1 Tax=Sorangium sp. So ce119 TaxID=3133279 RepID=UPI003F6411AA
MIPLLETALAFALIMLTASLFVSAVVQVIINVGRYRSCVLIHMLRSLIHGFRTFHRDPEVVDPVTGRPAPDALSGDESCEMRFVHEVLADPVLHARSAKLVAGSDPARLALLVEYIDADDLISIAAGASVAVDAEGRERLLPGRWVSCGQGGAVETKRYATLDQFSAYVRRWFPTLEGTASQTFKQRARQLTLLVSMMVVLLFNFDGFRVLARLHENGASRAQIIAQEDTVTTTAARLGERPQRAPDELRDATLEDFRLEMQKAATVLDEANLGIGWQESWIVARFCAYRGDSAAASPTALQLARDTLFWLAGLAFSCGMLSLGAPFWVTTFSRLIQMRNEVQHRKRQESASGARPASGALALPARERAVARPS